MKTTISLDTIRANRDTARKLEAEARELRYRNAQAREQLKAEENAILQTMLDTVQAAGAFMTASEIVAAIDGAMSVHEVAGQLTWARNSKDSGRKPQPYFGPSGQTMRHLAMSKAAPAIQVEERRVTRHFAEVDESGKVIKGGRKFKQTETRNIYKVER